MKKIAFMVQVFTIITALPLLTVLEINHGTKKTPEKNKNTYVNVSMVKSTGSTASIANGA